MKLIINRPVRNVNMFKYLFFRKFVVSEEEGLEKMTENRLSEIENREVACGLLVFAVFFSGING
jgi:hypothetical protein